MLRPGGRFLLLEHGLSSEPRVRKWQRRLNGMQRWLADNCSIIRPIRHLIEQQPFTSTRIAESYLDKTPRPYGYIYQGVAIK